LDRTYSNLLGSITGSTVDDGLLAGVIGLFIVFIVLRFVPRVFDSVVFAFAGEPQSLMIRGFLRHGTRVRRTIELQAVISRLALITRMNLPCAPALYAASAGESGRMNRMLRGLAERLSHGVSVSSALDAVVSGCPKLLVAALRNSESCGQLARALQQQERMIHVMIERQFQATAHLRHAVAYGTVMVFFCGVMVVWIAVILMPKFKEIFLDFEVALPGVTLSLLHFADWFFVYAPGVLLVLASMSLSVIVAVVLIRRRGNASAGARVISQLRSSFPLTRSLDRALGMAKAIRSMELAIRSGAPNAFAQKFSQVVSNTNSLRGRLDTFSEGVSGGARPHDAAGAAKLGDVFVCAMRMVERGEDPERVLGHAADYYEAIADRWLHALVAISGPIVTVCMGFMVGFVALALFMPLIALIDSVSGGYG